jgi:hypothetical protein
MRKIDDRLEKFPLQVVGVHSKLSTFYTCSQTFPYYNDPKSIFQMTRLEEDLSAIQY